MDKAVVVTSWKYDVSSRYLKIFYNNGSGELYHPVPESIYDNLLRSTDKAAFVHKYLEFDLHFKRLCISTTQQKTALL
ncbi:KTSC domain protein [Acinetobacter sp. COS3]|uniref:KTSC domain-containing protein n=1 Tax=Acinetobacter sp. COS3 TaxID=1397525 RepID=UPI0003B92274|nr:KTSC domain-containing protein [Acinetobacter sp. COS3]ERS04027.1 KTSC domain protein [Acinetobacter sp. COS3]